MKYNYQKSKIICVKLNLQIHRICWIWYNKHSHIQNMDINSNIQNMSISCKFPDCNNIVWVGGNYCFDHKCIVGTCTDPILPCMLSLETYHRSRTCEKHLCNSLRAPFRNSIYCPIPKHPQYSYCVSCKCVFNSCDKPKIHTTNCGSCGMTIIVSEIRRNWNMCSNLKTVCGVCKSSIEYSPADILHKTKKSNYCCDCYKNIHIILALTKYCRQKYNSMYDIIKFIILIMRYI